MSPVCHSCVFFSFLFSVRLFAFRFVPLSSGKKRLAPVDEDVIVSVASDDITDDVVEADRYQNLNADGQPIKVASVPKPSKKGQAVDPSTLTPHAVTPSDTSMGVITVMGMECK